MAKDKGRVQAISSLEEEDIEEFLTTILSWVLSFHAGFDPISLLDLSGVLSKDLNYRA